MNLRGEELTVESRCSPTWIKSIKKRLSRFRTFDLVFLTVVSVCSPAVADELANAQAYSILKKACFECHGKERQDGGLRLDSHYAVLKGGDSGASIDLRTPNQSEMIRRISLPKEDSEVMPKRGDPLSKMEQDIIRVWIGSGANWSASAEHQRHWSYVAPSKPNLPVRRDSEQINPIDAFVLQGLQRRSMAPNPSADSRVLVRRLHLDILGIPPSVPQVESFANRVESDGLQAAVEHEVDELLASRTYGQKWAIPWLDAARYADSHGFQRDDLHELWAYRDWVIDALNQDMPFDQFTIEQLAGDLLPNATESQRIATGFNRCAPCNVEAGTDPEENRFNQVVDRVNTLGYVWLGTSLECAQCHDHKYDPFSQKDYYGLFAYFNQTEMEADRANPNAPASIRFQGPYMELSDPMKEQARQGLEQEIKALELAIEAEDKNSPPTNADAGSRIVLKPEAFDSREGAGHEILDDQSILLLDDAPDKDTYSVRYSLREMKSSGLWIEALTHPSLPGRGPGRGDAKRPNFVLNEVQVYSVNSEGSVSEKPLSLASARADFEQKNYAAKGAIDGDLKTGWAIASQFGQDHWLAIEFSDPNQLRGAAALHVVFVQDFGSARTMGRIRVSSLQGDFHSYFKATNSGSQKANALRTELAALEAKRKELEPAKSLVMREVSTRRVSTMFERGDPRSPGQEVKPATPTVLHPILEADSPDRLTLAKWLVDRSNPLTARVIVNRIWSEIFGRGLVVTPEDFGLKGQAPSHPELLDWLACDWMERGWSQKQLIKTILCSETYRRSSKSIKVAQELDAENKWLARGPRFRMHAELIRDNALSIAGLLSLKETGPSIRPPQPAGLWRKVGGQSYDYQVSPGDDQFRRGVYIVLKRMSPYPSLINFDATPRLACRVKRGRSNTPLQALTLLNDPVYVQAAEALAGRVRAEAPSQSLAEQLIYAFQLSVARRPNRRELDLLQELYQRELALQEKEYPAFTQEKKYDRVWYSIATALLNLDETITKE
jgi:hypothetical protein